MRRTVALLGTLMVIWVAAAAHAANPLEHLLENFESGGTHEAVAATPGNSPSLAESTLNIQNVVDDNSHRLRLGESQSNCVGAVVPFKGVIPAPGYYLVTAEVKVDDTNAPMRSFGMAPVVGGPTTAKISDANAGYVMNLSSGGNTALGYQTIGAAIQVGPGGTFPKDLTLYFSPNPSGNDYNAPANDGRFAGMHRSPDTACWPAGTANQVFIDNIKLIGPGNLGEERHMWISVGDAYTDLNKLESTLVACKQNNFNCVDILARYRADAYYVPNRDDSTYPNPEPFGTLVGGIAASPSNDPLQYAIDRGHELGLKVYISFSAFCVGVKNGSTPPSYPSFMPQDGVTWYYNNGVPRPMTESDPSADGGIWADPGVPAVRDYMKNVMMDIVSNYEIDGVIFDRIRYPTNTYGYNPTALTQYGIQSTPTASDPTFVKARQNAVTTFLHDAYEAATAKKPWMIVGTVPIAYGNGLVDTYKYVFQHYPSWMARKTANRVIDFGCCDLIQPQFYRTTPYSNPAYQAPEANKTLMLKGLYGDLSAYNLDYGMAPGSMTAFAPLLYHPKTSDSAQSAANSQNIIDTRMLGLNGFGFFNAGRTLPDISMIRATTANSWGVDVLATPVSRTDYLMKAGYDNIAPNSVTNFQAGVQSDGKVRLSWTLPAKARDGEIASRYLIYRSKQTPVHEYRANLVTTSTIGGSQSSFVLPPMTSGNYFFRIVAVDKYNNHSQPTEIGPYAVTGSVPADLIVDNPQAVLSGTWTNGSSATDKYGSDYAYAMTGTGSSKATFSVTIPTSGMYNVCEWHTAGTNRSTNTHHTVQCDAGNQLVTVNQQTNGGKWNQLGLFPMSAGKVYSVTIDDSTPGTVIADAIKWSFVGPALPAAPTSLMATSDTPGCVGLSWSDNTDLEDYYVVRRSTTPGGPYSDVATLEAGTTAFIDTGLAAGTYFYVVRALNGSGASQASNEASATVVDMPPSAPNGLVATTVSPTQIDLTWNDTSSNEESFEILRSTTPGGPYALQATVEADVTSYSDKSAAPQQVYYYVVRAVNRTGVSPNSNEAMGAPMMPPTPPSALAAVPMSGVQIDLSWTDNSSNEANFIVARANQPGGPYSDIATLGPNATSYSDTGLSYATYYYVVRAVNAAGASANSNEIACAPLPPPPAPSALSAVAASGTQINLSWADNASDEISYVVARSIQSGGPYSDIATLGPNTTAYSDLYLAAGTYYYVVRATNVAGTSANSNEASASVTGPPPTAPANLSATVTGADQITLSWLDQSDNESSFEICRAQSETGRYTTIAYVAPNNTIYIDEKLMAGRTYFYKMRAVGAAGTSEFSNTVSATIPKVSPFPATPSELTAKAISPTQIELKWKDNATNEQQYKVEWSPTKRGPWLPMERLGANSTSYTCKGLRYNTVYYFRVKAVNSKGESKSSNVASARTQRPRGK